MKCISCGTLIPMAHGNRVRCPECSKREKNKQMKEVNAHGFNCEAYQKYLRERGCIRD